MATRKKTVAEDEAIVESEFSKEQLLAANRFQHRKDVLNALLADDKTYTVTAVEKMIDEFMERQVK